MESAKHGRGHCQISIGLLHGLALAFSLVRCLMGTKERIMLTESAPLDENSTSHGAVLWYGHVPSNRIVTVLQFSVMHAGIGAGSPCSEPFPLSRPLVPLPSCRFPPIILPVRQAVVQQSFCVIAISKCCCCRRAGAMQLYTHTCIVHARGEGGGS